MGAAITLAKVDANSIVYLVESNNAGGGEGGEIGGTTSVDLTTEVSIVGTALAPDAASTAYGLPAGAQFRRVCRAGLDGLGVIVAGAPTQAQVRALFFGDGAVDLGPVPRARCRFVRREGDVWASADASADGTAIEVTVSNALGYVYLVIELAHSLDR